MQWKVINNLSKIERKIAKQFTIYTLIVFVKRSFICKNIRLCACACSPIPESERIFTSYSKEKCMFECLLSKARTATKCTPWMYPNLVHNFSYVLFGFYQKRFFPRIFIQSALMRNRNKDSKLNFTLMNRGNAARKSACQTVNTPMSKWTYQARG